jgi:hypothetical protein
MTNVVVRYWVNLATLHLAGDAFQRPSGQTRKRFVVEAVWFRAATNRMRCLSVERQRRATEQRR